jgi:hypothetical protein
VSRVTRETPAGRAYNDLRNLAKREGRDVAEYLTLYALEGLPARLAASDHAADFVLKGGTLMAAFAARRPTRDLDFAASGFTNDVADCVERIRAITAVTVDDGLVFDAESARGEVIRDEGAYAGVRVHIRASLATANLPLHADVNFGDPIWPAPVPTELPKLLGGTLTLLGYPDHMVLAEKIVTAVERGTANTRWRDFVDIDIIARRRTILADDLAEAIDTVARYRGVTLAPLTVTLDGMAPIAQARWITWRRKQRLEETTPADFGELLSRCVRFADPVMRGEAVGQTWHPDTAIWREGPPTRFEI